MSPKSPKPVILIVLDGWGYSENTSFNAIHGARKPTWDKLWADSPHTLISASGTDVGLPDKQMGNSEVGHMNIGSGRVIDQEFSRITRAIEDGSFYKNEVLCSTLKNIADTGKAVHILGLLSNGGVHSHQEHIFALMALAQQHNIGKIYLHAFLDGRDTSPRSAPEFLQYAETKMQEISNSRIASVIGRFYAMDRNQNWDRTRLAYELLTQGIAEHHYTDALSAIEMAYKRGESDEFVLPTAIADEQGNTVKIEPGDAIIFANYRADRARQLSLAFTKDDFNSFPRTHYLGNATFVSLTEYKANFDFPVAFPPLQHKNVFGEYIADQGLRQLRIAETEKYAHVTFFFNGGKEQVFANEDRILVPSPHVSTYDQQPEMNAQDVTDKMVEAIKSRQYDAIICNFANADMVGHTGDYTAAVKAIETLDHCLHRIVETSQLNGAEILITADHGNAEKMREFNDDQEQSQPHTAHTNNLVPLVYVGSRPADIVNEKAALCDLAPTMLHLMGLDKPEEMTGRTIFRVSDEH
jgi:2,3-bisphosphoglycerate-independent phosphoglycerate mutase